MPHNLEPEIPKALEQLLKSETDYNAIVHIGKEPDFKEFHAHSNILRCRSEYFDELFSAEDVKKKDGKYIIEKQNIAPQAFDDILKYIYIGHIEITNKTGVELLDIMTASDELELKILTKYTENFIIENCHRLLQNDPVGVLQTVHYNLLVNLQELCLEEICFEPGALFNSNKFTKLPAPLLELILRRDDLNFSEIKIWKYLIKWGLAQVPTLNQDVTKWVKDDVDNLKRVFNTFIPLIRFYEISAKDYYDKVKPYEEILSKELRDDILKFYMVPGYKPTLNNLTPRHSSFNVDDIDSILINQEHVALFANWIDRKKGKSRYKDISYKFNLLYRASRDGDTAAAFHKNCDNKGATIVVIKIKNLDQLTGGYNPLQWDSSGNYKSTDNSFIFSLTDKNNFQTAKIGYSNGDIHSIGCFSDFGPLFGYSDLYLNQKNHNWYCEVHPNNSYPKLDNMQTGSLIVEDYEVFRIRKKNLRSKFKSLLIFINHIRQISSIFGDKNGPH